MAKWLIDQGTDLIIGPSSSCHSSSGMFGGTSVFFSLGNHLFDQKYPATKQGLIADCTVSDDQLNCSSIKTTTPPNSSFPEIAESETKNLAGCGVAKNPPLVINNFQIALDLKNTSFVDGEIVLEGKSGAKRWTVAAKRLLSLAKGLLAHDNPEEEFLFTLEAHPSSIDQEIGPRPYVYAVAQRGLIAKWRGSALAWPLLDAELIHSPSEKRTIFAPSIERTPLSH